MSQVVLEGHNINVLPYDICLNQLMIVKRINDHARASIVAVVPDGEKDKYINMTKIQTPMEINHVSDSGTTCLFKGIMMDIEVKAVRGACYARIEGVPRRKIKGGDKIDNPDVKYFRTKPGKEAMFKEKELVLSAKDDKVLIRLNEDTGIEIYSENTIKIKDDNDLEINAEKIEMKAADEIDVVCKSSTIKMDGTTHIRGSIVKVRC